MLDLVDLGLKDVFNQLTKGLLAALLTVTGLFVTTTLAAGTTPAAPALTGYDVSYPQCGRTLPSAAGFGIDGVNDGHPFSTNPCLSSELRWSKSTLSKAPVFYMNTGNPGPAHSSSWPTNQQSPRICEGANSPDCSYDFGWNAARVSFNNAAGAESADGSLSPSSAAKEAHWWLDVETGNKWETLERSYGKTASSDANDQQMLQGSIAYLLSIRVASVGVYSTPSQWKTITGGTGSTFPAVPLWVPGYATLSAAESACTSTSFTGGRVAMIQFPSNGLDGDYVCGLSSTPAAGSVTVVGSSIFTDQLVVSGNDGAVTYVQTTGTPALTVNTTGLIATSGALAPGSYTASGTTSDPNGDIGTFSFTLSVGTITQSLPASSSTKTVGSSTFTDQLVVSGNDGAVTYVQTSGTPALTVNATGLIATSGALAPGSYTASGTTSDPNGDIGTFSFTLSVGTIAQSLPTLSSVATTGSLTFTSQIAVIRNDGAVTYVQTSGTPALTVNATGLIATSGALAPGSYTARGTTSDTFGDKGKFVFTLNITAPAPIPIFSTLSATQVVGHAVAGTSVILTIDGAGFYGRPRVTSHAGTSVLVTRDTGTLLVVKVTVRARSRNGIFFFTVTAAHGQSTRVKYNQR
jgi:hypothetical protein